MKNRHLIYALPFMLFALAAAPGCIRTTHEIKPIHITMDINLKVDRALDDFFGDIDNAPATPQAPEPEEDEAIDEPAETATATTSTNDTEIAAASETTSATEAN